MGSVGGQHEEHAALWPDAWYTAGRPNTAAVRRVRPREQAFAPANVGGHFWRAEGGHFWRALKFIAIGASIKIESVLDFSDAMVFLLCVPNILGLLVLAPVVKRELHTLRAYAGE